MLNFDFPDAITVIERQIAGYVSNASQFGTLFTTNLQRLKQGWGLIDSLDKQALYWTNIIELQIKQLADETGGDLFTAGKQIGQAYESALAQYGLKLATLKELLPTETKDLLGYSSAPSIIQSIRSWVLDLLFPGKVGLLTSEQIAASRTVSWILPEAVGGALGIAAFALPVYLFLRSKANSTIDEIDHIESDIAAVQVVFKNRKVVKLDATDKTNPTITDEGFARDLSAPVGSFNNPVTTTSAAKSTSTGKTKKVVLKPTADELTNLALAGVAKVLDGLPARLSFELATKTNPVQTDGTVLQGKYIVLHAYLLAGQSAKSSFTTIPLRLLKTGEIPLTTIEEQPVEDEITRQVKLLAQNATTDGLLSTLQQSDGTSSASAATGIIGARRFGKVGTDVYEVLTSGAYRHIELTEFKSLGLNIDLLPTIPAQPNNIVSTDTTPQDTTASAILPPAISGGTSLPYRYFTLTVNNKQELDYGAYQNTPFGHSEISFETFVNLAKQKDVSNDTRYNGAKTYYDWLQTTGELAKISPGVPSDYIIDENGVFMTRASYAALHGITNKIAQQYVRFAGSPDIFDRTTGKFVSYKDAVAKAIFSGNQIIQLTYPRPEVKQATDFAIWSGKDLLSFPV